MNFESPNGIYQLEYPQSFEVTYENDVLCISPPNNDSCLTISPHYFPEGIGDLEFATLFQKLTMKYEAIQPPHFLSKNVLIQRLKKTKPNNNGDIVTTFWTICLYRKNQHLLVISINIPGKEETTVFEEYEQMLNSISM